MPHFYPSPFYRMSNMGNLGFFTDLRALLAYEVEVAHTMPFTQSCSPPTALLPRRPYIGTSLGLFFS